MRRLSVTVTLLLLVHVLVVAAELDKPKTEPLQFSKIGTPGQQPSDKREDKAESEPLQYIEAGTPRQKPLKTRDRTTDKPTVPTTAPAKPQASQQAASLAASIAASLTASIVASLTASLAGQVTRHHGSRHSHKIVCDDMARLTVNRIKAIREGYSNLKRYYKDQLASDLPTLMTADVETSFQGPYAFKAVLDMAEFYNKVVFPDAMKDPELTTEVSQAVIKMWIALKSLSRDMKTCVSTTF